MVKIWSDRKKVVEKIPGTKINQYYLRRHFWRPGALRRRLSPNPPKTFERKLSLFWLKEPIIKLQKSFCFVNFELNLVTFVDFENVRVRS